jgi:hypothetical protein
MNINEYKKCVWQVKIKLYVLGLMTPEHLTALAQIITTMQPHGALIALYLMEIPVKYLKRLCSVHANEFLFDL